MFSKSVNKNILSFPRAKIFLRNAFRRIFEVLSIDHPIKMSFSPEKGHFKMKIHHFVFKILKWKVFSWPFLPNLSARQVLPKPFREQRSRVHAFFYSLPASPIII